MKTAEYGPLAETAQQDADMEKCRWTVPKLVALGSDPEIRADDNNDSDGVTSGS